jgi:alpha-mannosidase
VFSTPEKFLQAVLAEPHNFPVVRTEPEPTLRGAYTTVGEIKKGNRYSENLLLTLEKFASVADRLGARPYPKGALLTAWKAVMLNQFHDTISGTDVPPATEDALRQYGEVAAMAGAELRATLSAITERINTGGSGTPIVVFNPVAWDRTDLVEVELERPQGRRDACDTVVDDQGKAVATQALESKDPAHVRIAFVAENVPSLGYRTYRLAARETEKASLKASLSEMENEYFRVSFDPATGCLSSVFDKTGNRETLAQPGRGNLIQVLDDPGNSEGFLYWPDGREEHNVWDGPCVDVVADPEVRVIEDGPVRATVEVKKKLGLARFTQRITLYRGVHRVDFALDVKWQGVNKMVKVDFPLAVSAPEAAYEIPYGVIMRKSGEEEFAAQNWVDITQDGYGVSLLNDSRYGYDITPNTIRLSVLRSPDHPVAAMDEAGVHTVKYALCPHADSWQQAGIVRRGQEFNNPLIAVAATAHKGELPHSQAFLRVEPENVLVSAMKKAEDSDDIVLRCYESTGAGCIAKVTLSDVLAINAVHATDLLEKSQSELKSEATAFEAPIGAWAIESYMLIKD